ncbi:MAG TPA: hypothetical protein VM942_01470 [Acidimicrobiales bacterium]|nr:hypothetical protein [Acidimicrobiales bacterium]
MPRRTRFSPAVLLALLITVALVAASVVVAVRVIGDDDAESLATPTPTTTTTPDATTPDSTTPDTGGPAGSTPPPAAPSDLPPAQARTVAELKAQVAEIRGLQWKADLSIRIVSPEELARRVVELTVAERQEHLDDQVALEIVLELLQLIPSDLDLASTIDKLLAGGVLGFYDDETRELFVGGDPDSDLDLATRTTMVHELTHALTDQHFDFGARNQVLSDEDLGEEAYALSALLEGDAELVRALWADEHLTPDQQLEAELGSGGADPSVYLDMPPYILESLFFPYLVGVDFVAAIHDAGGFAAVDNAYRQPPTSTEEILHPDIYVPGGKWARPALPDLAAATGCTAVDTSTIGEFDMTQVLDRHLGASEARRAAAGWNGDAYGLVRCGSAAGLAGRWRADTPGDLTELADSLARWAEGWSGSSRPPDADGRFSGPSGSGRIIRAADRVDLVIAEDASTSDRLSAAVLAA